MRELGLPTLGELQRTTPWAMARTLPATRATCWCGRRHLVDGTDVVIGE
jgi:hypothetical protein